MLINGSAINALVINGGGSTSSGSTGGSHTGTPSSARYVSNAELTRLLDGAGYSIASRISIPDPSGVIWDYSTRDDINWIHSIEYSGGIDNNIGTATVKLWREVGVRSLAPFRTNSAYNVIPFLSEDAALGTGPSLDAGRRITIDVATVGLGATPADSDYHTVFDGYIDKIDWAAALVVLECRDLAAPLADQWFTSPGVVGASFLIGPLPIAIVMDALLVAAALDVRLPLVIPDATPIALTFVSKFRWQVESILTALTRLADSIGWDLRMRWSDADNAFRLTFRDPGRNKTTADWTIPPASYYDFSQFQIDRTNIRNDITVYYGPANARTFVGVFADDSVARYGRKSMVIQEASDSAIQDSTSAQILALDILGDLAEPEADAIFEMPYFWPADLNDIIKLPANLVHSDTDEQYAIVAYRHTLDGGQNGKSRSQFTLRGKPASAYWRWFARQPVTIDGTIPEVGDGTNPVPKGFSSLLQTPDYATNHITFSWTWTGDPAATFKLFVQRGVSGFEFIASLPALTASYDFTVGIDIEPFHTPPTPRQLAVDIAFAVIALSGSTVLATSRNCAASYGNGP